MCCFYYRVKKKASQLTRREASNSGHITNKDKKKWSKRKSLKNMVSKCFSTINKEKTENMLFGKMFCDMITISKVLQNLAG